MLNGTQLARVTDLVRRSWHTFPPEGRVDLTDFNFAIANTDYDEGAALLRVAVNDPRMEVVLFLELIVLGNGGCPNEDALLEVERALADQREAIAA
jgi:hypothetical protein